VTLLPPEYRSLVMLCKEGKGRAADTIREIAPPLSRLIACALYTKEKGDDEGVLTLAVATASQEGWKRALIVYLERLASYYERQGDRVKAARVRTRLAIINS